MMKVVTWNINGIRALKYNISKELLRLDADIICFQETKVTRDQLDEATAIVDGYSSYFSFSKVRSGYSGVATYVKDALTPTRAEAGLTGLLSGDNAQDLVGCYGDVSEFDTDELAALDKEGRTVITQHAFSTSDGLEKTLSVINVYCPRADPEREERAVFKMRFYQLLEARALALLNSGSHVIILGDVNTSHKRIDSCDPAKDFEERPTRKWLDQFLWDPGLTEDELGLAPDSHRFVDTFRYYRPDQEKAYTCWNTVTGARATNYGTRIDYIFADFDLTRSYLTDCVIMPDIEGSDHCPVKATFNLEVIGVKTCPKLCTKYMPEFAGKQQKLSAFFVRKQKSDIQHDELEFTNSSKSAFKETINVGDGTSVFTVKESFKPGADTIDKDELAKAVIPPHTSSIVFTVLKRNSTSKNTQPGKRQKKDEKKPGGASKQTSMLGFLNASKKTVVTNSNNNIAVVCETNDNVKETTTFNDSSKIETSNRGSVQIVNDGVEKEESVQDEEEVVTSSQEELTSSQEKQSSAVSSWKNLFKGPAPAPLCRGHQEACVLRTVKKADSLNRGRQFWVCQRPDGEKSNPLARCDHFQWVERPSRKKPT